jgi:hypothetical protein
MQMGMDEFVGLWRAEKGLGFVRNAGAEGGEGSSDRALRYRWNGTPRDPKYHEESPYIDCSHKRSENAERRADRLMARRVCCSLRGV